MSEPDVVAELDRWANDTRRLPGGDAGTDLLKRARDEIVALRAKCIELSADRTGQLVADRRAKVLEEAARAVEKEAERGTLQAAGTFAFAIRALKGEGDG